MPLMSNTDMLELIEGSFPLLKGRIRFEPADDGRVRFRYRTGPEDVRPGDTVSGPTLMGLSDLGTFLAILAECGPKLFAVTTSLNINFLRKPPVGELIVDSKLLKLGKRLAVGEVSVFTEDSRDPVSHATVTFSVPEN